MRVVVLINGNARQFAVNTQVTQLADRQTEKAAGNNA